MLKLSEIKEEMAGRVQARAFWEELNSIGEEKEKTSAEKKKEKTYPISRALTNPTVGGALGALSNAALTKKLTGSTGAALAAGAIGGAQGASISALSRWIHARARKGRTAKGTAWESEK
jgi:hypothetical protein